MKFDKNALTLYAVTDRTWLNGRRLYDDVKKAVIGGATLIQLREKNLSHDDFKTEALEIQELCREFNVPFIINDDVELACEINADGVHVGQSDMSADNVRALIGNDKILGVSVRTVDEAILAEHNGADYLGAGAVFHTGSKSDAVDITHETLKKICGSVKIPVVAIGGINEKNIHELKGTGIAGIAVISAIFASENIEEACIRLRQQFLTQTERY
ncbi:MAG: thiamine phosphate synthase [Synergistaceae bacterium]|nr:thiamine phosphate synthase [Synergistaceae bacterium]MBR0316056.1 thiamine phosphate synthase [Synergistaceae bacterium]